MLRGHVAGELLERFSVVFAKLLDLLPLVHGLVLLWMGSDSIARLPGKQNSR